MKVTKENTGNLTAVLRIDIAQEDYTPKLEEQLKSYRRKANVPGFRPGQAPIGMIKKMYEIPLRAEIIEKAMSDAMYDYIDKEKVRILGYPLANEEKTVIDWNNQKEFTFYFDFEADIEDEKVVNLMSILENQVERFVFLRNLKSYIILAIKLLSVCKTNKSTKLKITPIQ